MRLLISNLRPFTTCRLVMRPFPTCVGAECYRPVSIPVDTATRFEEVASTNTRNNVETCGILAGKLVSVPITCSHVGTCGIRPTLPCSPSVPLIPHLMFPSCSPYPPPHVPLLFPLSPTSCSLPVPLIPPHVPLLFPLSPPHVPLLFPLSPTSCSLPVPLIPHLMFPSCSPYPPPHVPLIPHLMFPSCSPYPPPHVPLLFPYPPPHVVPEHTTHHSHHCTQAKGKS